MNFEEYSFKSLQKKLKEEFDFDASVLTTKKQAVEIYKQLSKTTKKEEEKPVVKTTNQEKKEYKSKIEKMKEKCAKADKIRILIPLNQGEKRGTVMPLSINGYRLNVQKGVMVELPRPFAELVEQSLRLRSDKADELNLKNKPEEYKRQLS